MRIRLSKKLTRGMTLVEVVIATGIIAITGAGVIGSIDYGLCIMRIARENQRATQVLLEKLEAIRLYNWSQVTNSGFVPTSFTAPYDPTASSGSQGTTYYGSMSVSLPAFTGTTPNYAASIRQFNVSVTWTNLGGLTHTRSLSTYVAQNGVQNYVY
ncbi:MAG TPA: type II secretion system protein [Verrucomicrobiae bacterium]|nr:type II secretion system protein [Verrucomicrobiae bacterium]